MPDQGSGKTTATFRFRSEEDLHDRKRKVEAIKGISFSVAQEMVSFLGPGARKTTTIKSILGLVRPDSGGITVDGIDCARIPVKP